MSELLRFHTPRNPDPIKRETFNIIAIDSHPANYRSADYFTKWVEFCNNRDYDTLKIHLINFLKSKHSITSINDYPGDVPNFLEFALSKGNNITESDIIAALKAAPKRETISNPEILFNQEILFEAITRTSDTLLALVLLKKSCSVKDISYQDILKLLFYVDHITNEKNEMQQMNLKDYLGKQIMLPPCFIHINPCSKKIEGRADYFLLDDKSLPCRDMARNTGDEKISGNIEILNKEQRRPECECVPDENCVKQNPCCATIKPYITDLMVVREEAKGYIPGELSYIENILMGEDRTREHRHLERTEEYEEQEQEISRSIERDLQGSQQFSLNKATDETIKQDLSLDPGVTLAATLGNIVAGTSLSLNSNSNYDWSKSTAQKIAREYSKDVVMRAVTKVEEKIRELVTRKHIIETEEKNTHVFKNAPGEDNISGQYFYVNKISRAQVFNYGKRLLCDILVPEPSELYKRLIAKQFNFNLKEPEKPTITPTKITAANYKNLIQKYGLTDCEPIPEMAKSISMPINGNLPRGISGILPGGISGIGHPDSITVPVDFVTESMSSQKIGIDPVGGVVPGFPPWSLYVSLGGKSVFYSRLGPGPGETETTFTLLPPIEGTQPLSIQSSGVNSYYIILTVNFKLRADLVLLWQMSIYNKIMEVYEKQKREYDDAYNSAVEEFERNKAAKYSRNAFLNRETERIELKRMAISYISCKFYDEMNAMKNKVSPCGFPQMDLEETEREGRWVRFFEQAFEWSLMTYLFYPYFWGRKCTWVDKMKEEADDPIFEKFLQSGFARLQVPVRPGFEELVEHFLAFGEIWPSNDFPPLPGNPYYVSMAQEIREQRVNFYTDRQGTLAYDSAVAKNIFTLTDDTKHYWDGVNNVINQQNITADIDREITIDCKVYRIISITETITADPDHRTWTITIDRAFEGEGKSFSNMKWSTGAVYIGAPWEFVSPTQLVWLRGKAKCLPSYPIE